MLHYGQDNIIAAVAGSRKPEKTDVAKQIKAEDCPQGRIPSEFQFTSMS